MATGENAEVLEALAGLERRAMERLVSIESKLDVLAFKVDEMAKRLLPASERAEIEPPPTGSGVEGAKVIPLNHKLKQG